MCKGIIAQVLEVLCINHKIVSTRQYEGTCIILWHNLMILWKYKKNTKKKKKKKKKK